ncbi:MAG TPA: collagen-like protein [Solirubrobacterales bacterium]|nr:collagen-like protein [Solirubrobacterales bacterium]
MPGGRIGALGLAVLVAVLVGAVLALGAGGATVVGKDGKVYACYKAKGKSKGSVRLVAKKAHCRHGEKKVSWNAVGPAGETGKTGDSGPVGERGPAGERGPPGQDGSSDLSALEERITNLTSTVAALEPLIGKVATLESTLDAKVTELEGVITKVTGLETKLQGISATELKAAVESVADVNALCAQAATLTTRANELGTAISGISLLGVIPGVLEVLVPAVPASLGSFSC